jgi:putative transposase
VRRGLLEGNGPLPLYRQCGLLGVSRNAFYHRPRPESAENLGIMALIDRQYLRTPYYGCRRMRQMLADNGLEVNLKRVRRLMQLMGIEAIYPKKRLSAPGEGHKVYPYLLRGVEITHANHVWSTDITYIGMRSGFMYLCAVIDWYSRYVLGWSLSNSLHTSFCIEALEKAFREADARPLIFNTDQGAQFTSSDFTSVLEGRGIRISMDGKGRAIDNVFIERLWRTVKYEDLFIREYRDGRELRQGLDSFFRFYNTERPHQALGYKTPAEIFCKSAASC